MPGGLGTIQEALKIMLKKQIQEIPTDKPLIFLGNYYKEFIESINNMQKQGFIKEPLDKLYQFAHNPEEVVKILQNYH